MNPTTPDLKAVNQLQVRLVRAAVEMRRARRHLEDITVDRAALACRVVIRMPNRTGSTFNSSL